jgi:hypothetical protein
MAQLLDRVQPGDLITADMWNLAVDAINELLQSGQTTGIKVTAMMPAGTVSEPIRVGTTLQIVGQDFGYSIGLTKVLFEAPQGTVVVTRDKLLAGSADNRLLLLVPPIPGLPQSGATMTLRVDNGVANDARSVFVMPIVITLEGDVFVNWRADVTPNPNPNPLQPDQSADFAYDIQTGINMPATFDLDAKVLNAPADIPANFDQSIEFLDAKTGSAIPGKRLEMGKTEIRSIVVRIPKLPATWGGQDFSLKVSAASGKVTNADMRPFTVGKLVPPTDPDIQPQLTGSVVLDTTTGSEDPAGGSFDGTIIKLKPDRQLIMMFNVLFVKQGTFDLTVKPKEGTVLNGWVLQLVNTASTIKTNGDNESKFVQVGVSAPSSSAVNPTPTGTVVFRIQRQGATMDWSKEYGAQLLPLQ